MGISGRAQQLAVTARIDQNSAASRTNGVLITARADTISMEANE